MEPIVGYLVGVTGEPVKPEKAFITGALSADNDRVQLPVPVPVEVEEDGLILFQAPQGRATLTLRFAEQEISLPIVVAPGFSLADAVEMGGKVDGITGPQMIDLVERAEKVAAGIDKALSDAAHQISQDTAAGRDMLTRAAAEARDNILAEVDLSVEQARVYRDESADAVAKVATAVQQIGSTSETLRVQLDNAQGLLDTMQAYQDAVDTSAEASQQAVRDAKAVVKDLVERVEILEVAALGVER